MRHNVIGLLIFAGAAAAFGAAAHAGNINTSGVICQNYFAGQALDIDYLTIGVRNINPAPRQVICAVPRSPLGSATTGEFFVDGHNNTGYSTSCTVTVYNYTGDFLGARSFTRSGDYDQLVTFPSSQLPMFAYVSVLCTLPGSGNATLYGITAVQP